MKSCLIVDDSKVVRKVACRIIADLGFSCREAGDGREALESCAESMPDAILLDWNMPVMNGLDFLQALRRAPGGAAPKVIFCTTENEPHFLEAALDAGADEYIMKPFDNHILESKFVIAGLCGERDE